MAMWDLPDCGHGFVGSLSTPEKAEEGVKRVKTSLPALSGKCSCGAVQYKCDPGQELWGVFFCHCSMCPSAAAEAHGGIGWAALPRPCYEGPLCRRSTSEFAERGSCAKCDSDLYIRYKCESSTDWLLYRSLSTVVEPPRAWHIHCKDKGKDFGDGIPVCRGWSCWEPDPCRGREVEAPNVCYRCFLLTHECKCRGGPLLEHPPDGEEVNVGTTGAAIPSTSFLNQERAIQVDVDLMSPEGGFSIDQLMELAGLSVSSAVAKEYPSDTHPRVLIICGPGNNGGDGLVAARHLHHFGYKPTVIYPKMEKVIASNELYRRLTVQLRQLCIPVTEEWQVTSATVTDLIIDAVFGFSFKGWRGGGKDAPFDSIIDFLATDEAGKKSFEASLVSVDIPSGWDVEAGPPDGKALQPDMLISLTAPKQCALSFRGKFHYLGGRFVPPPIVEKNSLNLPVYPGAEQCVKLALFPS